MIIIVHLNKTKPGMPTRHTSLFAYARVYTLADVAP